MADTLVAQDAAGITHERPSPSPPRRPGWTGRWALRVLLGLVCLAPVAVYVWIAFHQVGYRFELEWMEGGAVEVVRRVVLGQGIYVAPSLHFVPWPYTPFYWWVSAGVSHLTGTGFLPLRLVSLVSSLGSLVVLAALVRSETGEWVAGLAAAGIYAATYRMAGDWFAIGRVDSLMLLLLLLSLAAARRTRTWAGGVAVGVLGFLAFFTKQSALIAVVPFLGFMLVTRWRAGLAALGTLAGLIGVSTLAMNAATGGWYGYYVFNELTHQGIARVEWAQFWSHDLRPLWPAGLIALVGLGVWAFARTRSGGAGRQARRS
ncbi:MAG: glycosyltransferase family 39 protein, partial [Acidimicrobiales bacterium]